VLAGEPVHLECGDYLAWRRATDPANHRPSWAEPMKMASDVAPAAKDDKGEPLS
jgi:hypothetical protein